MVAADCALRDALKDAVEKAGAKFTVADPSVLNHAKAIHLPAEERNTALSMGAPHYAHCHVRKMVEGTNLDVVYTEALHCAP